MVFEQRGWFKDATILSKHAAVHCIGPGLFVKKWTSIVLDVFRRRKKVAMTSTSSEAGVMVIDLNRWRHLWVSVQWRCIGKSEFSTINNIIYCIIYNPYYILEEEGIRDFEILYIPVYDHMYSMYVILLEYVHTLRDKNSWSLVSTFSTARQRHASQLVAEWIAMNASKPCEFFQCRIADPCMTFRNT